MMELFISLGIAAILMALEYLLSAKLKNPFWGGIIPLILIIATIYIFSSRLLPLNRDSLFPFILLISFMLGDWISGREKYKKNQQKELDKMKAKDMGD
ncbi:hypothetical protein [Clostridium merdae]|uniref:hypothetical protein n=1 Tax=Clostridium merdae TaxID=1958780 RepID=UPI000A2725AB|nr:hypothetical protein [Clostridium merdae]